MVCLYEPVRGSGVQLKIHGGRLCFNDRVTDLPRVAVITTPKSGTYLIAKLLEMAGWIDNEVHVSRESFTDYIGIPVGEKKKESRHRETYWPINVTSSLVLEGQFVVGHLACDAVAETALAGFRKVYVYREMRASFVSWVRFLIAGARLPLDLAEVIGGEVSRAAICLCLERLGEDFMAMASPTAGWLGRDGVFALNFETLMGDHGESQRREVLAELGRFLNLPDDQALFRLLPGALQAETKTRSGMRTDLDGCWSNEAERLFIKCGLYNLNSLLRI